MLKLKPHILNIQYRERWNVHLHDYCYLYNDGKRVSNVLYRVGGFGGIDNTQKYNAIIKNVESSYPDTIATTPISKQDKPHLTMLWCIINEHGIEKRVFPSFPTPYLCGGVIYTLGRKYYNIETGECYGQSCRRVNSLNYIFLEFMDSSVKKINKNTGECEVIK